MCLNSERTGISQANKYHCHPHLELPSNFKMNIKIQTKTNFYITYSSRVPHKYIKETSGFRNFVQYISNHILRIYFYISIPLPTLPIFISNVLKSSAFVRKLLRTLRAYRGCDNKNPGKGTDLGPFPELITRSHSTRDVACVRWIPKLLHLRVLY